VFGEINLCCADVEGGRYFLHRPVLDDVEIKNLILLRADLALDALDSGFGDVLFPFLIPDDVQIESGRILDALDRSRAAGVLSATLSRTFGSLAFCGVGR